MTQIVKDVITWLKQWFYEKSEVDTALSSKQATLVSGTNIKTVNNQSLLGSGNISVSGGGLSIDDVYPVGSIYMSVNSTSPATLFGGTWKQIEDKFLLASGSTYSAGSTGGSATVSLTQSQMPRHTHIQNSHTHTQDPHAHKLPHYSTSGTTTAYTVGWSSQKTIDASGVIRNTTATNQSTTATNKYAGGTGSEQSESDGSAHENMPPYLTVYMWKRTE